MRKLLIIAVLISAVSSCSPLFAQNLRCDSFQRGDHEFGVLIGYGENHKIPEATKDHFEFDALKLRYGKFTSPTTQTALELSAGKQFSEQDNTAVSIVGAYRKYFIRRGNTAVGYDFAFGFTHFNEYVQELGTKTNFTEQVGITFQHATSKDSAFTMEYRFIHVSNAGIKLPNIGINSSFVTLGYSWYRD